MQEINARKSREKGTQRRGVKVVYSMAETTIRFATIEDAEAILAIYAEYIVNTGVTFEIEVPTIEQFRERMRGITEQFPWLVCEVDGEIVGYAYGSKHGERAAYRWSADLSVYINEKFHRRGIASALYRVVMELLRLQGYYTVYAGVSTPNEKSEAFHTAFGFRRLGEFKNVGYKLGMWRGVAWYEMPLAEYVAEPVETTAIGEIRMQTDCAELLHRYEESPG